MNHKLIVNLVFSFSSSRNQMFVCFFLFFNTVLKQLLDFDQENAMDSTPADSLYFLCPCRFSGISLEGLFPFDYYI